MKSLLWPAHDEQTLIDQWKDLQPRLSADVPPVDPVAIYIELRQRDQNLQLREQSIVHGDLHMSNVALDSTARGPEAYIFDPGVIRRTAAGRDIAFLGVSVLLHQRLELGTLAKVCSVIYDATKPLDENSFGSLTCNRSRSRHFCT